MSYSDAKAKYAVLGVDADTAIAVLKTVPVSLHCWQGDDVRGFDTDPEKPLTGGIQTTGNYPGRARTPKELMADIDQVLKYPIEHISLYMFMPEEGTILGDKCIKGDLEIPNDDLLVEQMEYVHGQLVKNGFLENNQDFYKTTELGFLYLNDILQCFL